MKTWANHAKRYFIIKLIRNEAYLKKIFGKLGLDGEIDIKENKNKSLIDKPTTFPLIDNNSDNIRPIEDSFERSSSSLNKGM